MVPFALTSTAFRNDQEIPQRYTCQGDDTAPPLAWTGLPHNAKSLVLIVDDPDAPDPKAPKMTWVHWVVYNLPVSAKGLPEAVKTAALPGPSQAGRNDFKTHEYGGPCPPIGRHRYVFKLYALDILLPALPQGSKAEVEKAMAGHVLAKAELVGTYAKKPEAKP